MKKKFSLWLNIATICLCICAIAIGVYAVQSATLNVSGSVGFKAHNVEYTASASAKNFATDKEGDDFKDDFTDVADGTLTDNKLSLQTMYFSDKSGEVPNIELKITITNNSKFAISITPESESCQGVDITSTGATSAANGETATITYTLSLQKNSSGEYDNITANTLSISIKLEKKTISYKTDTNGNTIVVNKFDDSDKTIWNNTLGVILNVNNELGYTLDSPCYATYFPYYITMGDKDGTAIKWLIVGTNNNGTITALTTGDKEILETGKLLADTTYVALSAETLTTQEFLSNSNHEYDSSTRINVNTKTDYASLGVNASDYYASDIREYLNGTFKTSFELTDTIIKVAPRSVSELYDNIGTVSEGKISSKESVTGSDEFWLLSQAEVDTLFEENIIINSEDYKLASASITTMMGEDNETTTAWWLRSPKSSFYVYHVGDVGLLYIDYYVSNNTQCSVRPAFQF